MLRSDKLIPSWEIYKRARDIERHESRFIHPLNDDEPLEDEPFPTVGDHDEEEP